MTAPLCRVCRRREYPGRGAPVCTFCREKAGEELMRPLDETALASKDPQTYGGLKAWEKAYHEAWANVRAAVNG